MKTITFEDCLQLQRDFDNYCSTAEQRQFPALFILTVKMNQTIESFRKKDAVDQKTAAAMFRVILRIIDKCPTDYLDVKVGDTIKIINMHDEPQYNGRTGTITHIDDLGQLHGTWGGCALIPGVDDFETLLEAQNTAKNGF